VIDTIVRFLLGFTAVNMERRSRNTCLLFIAVILILLLFGAFVRYVTTDSRRSTLQRQTRPRPSHVQVTPPDRAVRPPVASNYLWASAPDKIDPRILPPDVV